MPIDGVTKVGPPQTECPVCHANVLIYWVAGVGWYFRLHPLFPQPVTADQYMAACPRSFLSVEE